MRQLLPPIEFAKEILGAQQYDENKNYRWLYFCMSTEYNNEYLLYNNLTREYLILTVEEFKELTSSNFSKPTELAQSLVEKWFLVPLHTIDYLLCDQIKTILKLYESDDNCICNFNIFPTSACNARCFYCFEAGSKQYSMDDKTAKDVVKYIVKKCEGKPVILYWFGGEPLCNIKAINIICDGLLKNNIKFKSRITTNGYLFDEKLISQAVENWNLKVAQVTLDGLAETYNRVKNYKNNDKNAFDKVINNMELLCKYGVDLKIRLNMDLYNSKELRRLIDYLNIKFGIYDNFAVFVRPIYEDEGFEKITHTNEERERVSDEFWGLLKYIDKLGLMGKTGLLRKYKTTSCQADEKSWAMILPDGHLGFCERFVDGDFYGTIFDDIDKPKWSEYKEIEEKCKECPAYIDCVRLKKCHGCSHECYDYEQKLRIDVIERGMITEYNRLQRDKTH